MSRGRTPVVGNAAREELLGGPTGTDFTWGDALVRVGDLPLFRRAGTGLRQAVRIVVHSRAALGPATVEIRDHNGAVDRAAIDITEGATRVSLFVPEVGGPSPAEVSISSSRGDDFRATVEVTPQRKWSIWLIHHSHLDIGYTDPQDLVLRHHLAYLDSVLDLVEATDEWPDAAMFRWNVEANWPLQRWLRSRPGASIEAFFERVRAGRIEVAALPFTMHTEAYSMDELARQLWFTDELRERFGIRIDTAMQTDVPGATLGLLTALADAEIRYLAVAHNYAGRSLPHLVDGSQLTRPFYWTGDAGRKLCVWYTDTPHGVAYMEGNLLGLADGYEVAAELLPEYLAALARRAYPYHAPLFGWKAPTDGAGSGAPYPHDLLHLRVQGAFADNASPSLIPAEIVRRWCSEWAYPELRLATNGEFFRTVEARVGESLDEFTGDWTDWWADGIGSAARPLGFNRRAQNTIRTAQTLNVLADHLGDGAPSNNWTAEVADAYEDMALFDEHTWGAANPWEDALEKMDSGGLQWERKSGFATAALRAAEQLTDAGLSRLAPLWSAPAACLGAIVVVNPSTWSRSDLVTAFVPESKIGASSFEVVDASNDRAVPAMIEDQSHPLHRPRGRHVKFVAHDLPPLGFAVYELRRGGISARETSSSSGEPVIENEYYEVGFDGDEGCITRILDRDSNRDLVAAGAPFGFNQYIYDRYATAPHFNHLSSRIQANDLALLGSRSIGAPALMTERSSTPLWDRLIVRLDGDGVGWLECTFTLLRGIKRLDIRNRMSKIKSSGKESAFFAFPLNADLGSLRYEITGGRSSTTGPHVPGSARHMRAIRHWVSARSEGESIAWATLEAPLVQFGNLHLPYAPFPPTLDPEGSGAASIYSWILNNLWDTNFPSRQGGEMQFHYALSSGADVDSELSARRTAAALTAPLLGFVVGPSESPSLPARGSFCVLDRPDVEVVALTRSRRGHDLVVMLQSHASETLEVHVGLPLLRPVRAWKGTHLERHMTEVPVDDGAARVPVDPGELAVLALNLQVGVP